MVWTVLGAAALACTSFHAGMRVATRSASDPAQRASRDAQRLADAVERYRADHGWNPADPERDYNSRGDVVLLRRQLTEFTRDDGKPSPRRDGEFSFGPYLRQFPQDAITGSRAVVVDQDQARAFDCLRADVAAGNGGGGWYYEVQTGSFVLNLGHGRAYDHRNTVRAAF